MFADSVCKVQDTAQIVKQTFIQEIDKINIFLECQVQGLRIGLEINNRQQSVFSASDMY